MTSREVMQEALMQIPVHGHVYSCVILVTSRETDLILPSFALTFRPQINLPGDFTRHKSQNTKQTPTPIRPHKLNFDHDQKKQATWVIPSPSWPCLPL